MKFGEYLNNNQEPEWVSYYINYDKLKKIIKTLEELHLGVGIQENTEIGTSLSVPRPTNAAGMPLRKAITSTQEDFFMVLESEMKKIEQFTKEHVEQIRRILQSVEQQIAAEDPLKLPETALAGQLRVQVENAGEEFLK